METLVVAFAAVWAGVALYVGWLGVEQRRLAGRLQQLEQSAQSQLDHRQPLRKAA